MVNKQLYREVGNRIQKLRKIKHFTREDLASSVNISAKFLYEIEAGRKGFSAETLCKMAEAFSVSCDYIMFGEDKENKDIRKVNQVLSLLDSEQIRRIKETVQVLTEVSELFEEQ